MSLVSHWCVVTYWEEVAGSYAVGKQLKKLFNFALRFNLPRILPQFRFLFSIGTDSCTYIYIYIFNSCSLQNKIYNDKKVQSQSFVHVPAVFRVHVSLPSPLFLSSLSSLPRRSLQPAQTFLWRTTLPYSPYNWSPSCLRTCLIRFQPPQSRQTLFVQHPLPLSLPRRPT
jgi:hypothetical protein